VLGRHIVQHYYDTRARLLPVKY